jgi:antitoxin (DNA-binding transcriptional repressor) of toxin-antitoxin stability system
LQEAQAHLADLIATLTPGEELVITQDGCPIAKLTGQPVATRRERQPGSAVGKVAMLVEDDAHLDDFREYMP